MKTTNCGIYKILNKVNNKIYIGSSYDIYGRWTDHKYLLNTNQHHSIHLQSAWNKYNKESFEFSILEECNQENLLKREQHYLNTLLQADSYIKTRNTFFIENGYNIKPFAESNLGFKHSKRTLEKIKKSKNLQVYAIDTDGKILGEFLTTQNAADFFGIQIAVVQTSTKNKKTTKYSNIGFCYVKDWYEGYAPKNPQAWMKGTIGVMVNANKKKVYVYDLKGNFIEEVLSQLECSKKYNITPPNLNRSLKEPIRISEMGKRKRKFLFREVFEGRDIILLRNNQMN